MNQRETKEFAVTFLSSSFFYPMFKEAFRPTIRRWVESLLHDRDLSHEERLGLLTAKEELYNSIVTLYLSYGLKSPEWLESEFFK